MKELDRLPQGAGRVEHVQDFHARGLAQGRGGGVPRHEFRHEEVAVPPVLRGELAQRTNVALAQFQEDLRPVGMMLMLQVAAPNFRGPADLRLGERIAFVVEAVG